MIPFVCICYIKVILERQQDLQKVFVDLNVDMIHAPMNMVPVVVYENDAKTRIHSVEYYIWHLRLLMPLRLLRLLPQTHHRPIYR